MDTAKIRRTFSERVRKLREGKLNQGEFADSVGISRGAMSYYEQEARTPDIGVLHAICEKYNVSADYLLGLMADPNHAVADVCKVTGLSPTAVRKLNIIAKLSAKEFNSYEDLIDEFDPDFVEAFSLAAFTSATQLINILLEHEDGLSLLVMLGAVILGAETEPGSGADGENSQPVIRIKSASENFQIALPIESLTAALWVNIQEHAHNLRRIVAQAEHADTGTQPSD